MKMFDSGCLVAEGVWRRPNDDLCPVYTLMICCTGLVASRLLRRVWINRQVRG